MLASPFRLLLRAGPPRSIHLSRLPRTSPSLAALKLASSAAPLVQPQTILSSRSITTTSPSAATMTARKRTAKATSPSSSQDSDAEEAHLDPKLATKGDASDEELQPARKKSKKEDGASSSSSATKKSSGKGGKYADGKPGSNVFNPGLPKDTTSLKDLKKALDEQGKDPKKGKGGNVIYWMRNKDIRISDNRALSIASSIAQENGKKHIFALHILSPEDFAAHDRSARRVDFMLRNVRTVQKEFKEKYNIPLVVLTHSPRPTIVDKVLSLAEEWGATNVCGNLEYEVDELWRDAKLIRQAKKEGKVHVTMVDDLYVVPPGAITTKDGRPYSVFSPWNRSWTAYIEQHMDILESHPDPEANDKAILSSSHKDLFDSKIPAHVEGFECKDSDYMSKLWPAGEEAAAKVLQNFFRGKGGLDMLEEPATADSTPKVSDPLSKKKGEESRLSRYAVGRNLMNENGTSHISPYLAAGIVSPRECLRQTKKITNNRLHVGRDSGPAMWNTEISFRDFYGHVLAAWPRVCMGRAYIPKYEAVVWEQDEKTLKAWKEGKTGYPIVDASMRQCAKQGYMHNRGRMITAMFLCKHLLQDWHHGEKWFMENFIDGDFASNNVSGERAAGSLSRADLPSPTSQGGWQWSASTGTDPQPYFRIFAPLSQSEKSDPEGDYIRHWVPELKNVKGKAIHAPHDRLSKAEFAKLGYPEPIVEHRAARERALRRFKDPGTE